MVVADGRLFTMGHDGQKREAKKQFTAWMPKQENLCGQILMKHHWSIIYMKVGRVPPQRWMAMRCMLSANTASSMPIRQVQEKKYGPRI